MIDKDFKTKIKTFSNKELLEQIDFMTEGYYSDLIEICLEELRCRLEAIEWHYPSKGELPPRGEQVLCWLWNGNYVLAFKREDDEWTTNGRFTFDGVKCWQYFVPPKEEA